MTITELAVKKPTVIAVIFIVLAIFGVISYNKLSYQLLPTFEVPLLVINTAYPGASPDAIETEVTKKIEDKISSLQHIKRIRSTSYESLSVIAVELVSGTDADVSLEDCQRKLNTVIADLPGGARTPTIAKVSSDGFPVLKYSISSNFGSNVELTQFLKDKIVPQVASVKDVADVSLVGGEDKAIRVNVDAEKLKGFNLSILNVSQAISANNLDFPTGKVEDATNSLSIKLTGKYDSVEALEDLVVVHTADGADVKLKDIATVVDDKKTVETISRINGKPSVELTITKQINANAVIMADLVKKNLAGLEKTYSVRNLKFDLIIDTTQFTLEAAKDVQHDMGFALILVALVILLFLHSVRDSFIVMLAIPSSFLGTLIAVHIFGYSLNLMTLLGLTLVVGILVDDSIVVLENIHRHLRMGKNKVQAAVDGRNEIGPTAVAITMVDVIVFLPLALSNSGITSSILRPFCWVIIISTVLSLFVSFTLTPLLASRFAGHVDLNKRTPWIRFNKFIEDEVEVLTRWYSRQLHWVLKHKRITIFGIFILFVAAMSLVANGFIANTFVEQGQHHEAIFYLEANKGSTLKNTDSLTKIAETKLLGLPEVTRVIADVGVSEGFFFSGDIPAYRSQFRVQFKGDASYKDEIFVAKAKKLLSSIPGATISNSLIDITGGPVDKPVQMVVSSDNADSVRFYSDKVKAILARTYGTSSIKSGIDQVAPEVKIIIDKRKMVALGLDVATVGSTMATAFHGSDDRLDDAKFNQGNTQIPIIVQLNAFDRRNPDDIGRLEFSNKSGALIELNQFAEIRPAVGLTQLQRTNRLTSTLVEASLIGRVSGDVGPEIDKQIAAAKFPDNMKITWIGEYENQQESGAIIGGAFGISMLLIYFLMVILYNNFLYPLVVLFAIPMSFIGAFLALALAKSSFSVFTLMGLIVMMGLVCKNSILIVDFANKEKEHGKNSFEALIAAGTERLRPILMTTMAMVLGMLPIAVASGAGSEWKNGMGWCLVGGLTSSMCLTLFIVPAVYLVVDTIKLKLSNKKSEKALQKV